MSPRSSTKGVVVAPGVPGEGAVIVRSAVPAGLRYPEYRPFLRRDFYCSCAYCTMAESEAAAVGFSIDHYEPQGARPELINEYSNLFYTCDLCNGRKGNRNPPPAARAVGHRFFRPDQDIHVEHFELKGKRLEPKSPTGEYSIECLDLNRAHLQRIRDLRMRLTNCETMVSQGVAALRRFPIDQLPTHLKGRAYMAIRHTTGLADHLASDIDRLLFGFAASHLLDADPEADKRAKARKAKTDALRALYPGQWRAPRSKADVAPPRKPAPSGKNRRRR